MAKDPAFLFYPGDWIGGTLGMTFEEKGAYMELLMLQFNRGHMTKHMMGQLVGQILDRLLDKFEKDIDGLYYNVRLEDEKNKRKSYVTSRLNNKNGANQFTKKEGHMTNHMEDENINEIEIINNNKNEVEKKFICPEMQKIFKMHVKDYSPDVKRDFEPLLSIATFIHVQEKLNGDVTKSNTVILDVWSKISTWVACDGFYAQKSLKTISNHIQEIYNKTKNGTHKQTTGGNKFTVGAENLLAAGKEAFADIRRRQGNQS